MLRAEAVTRVRPAPSAPLGHGWRSGRPTRRSAAAACGSAPRRLGQAHPGSKALGGVQPCLLSKPFLGALLGSISPPTAILCGSFSLGGTRELLPQLPPMPQGFLSSAREPPAPVVRGTSAVGGMSCLRHAPATPSSSREARPHCPLPGWPEPVRRALPAPGSHSGRSAAALSPGALAASSPGQRRDRRPALARFGSGPPS